MKEMLHSTMKYISSYLYHCHYSIKMQFQYILIPSPFCVSTNSDDKTELKVTELQSFNHTQSCTLLQQLYYHDKSS